MITVATITPLTEARDTILRVVWICLIAYTWIRVLANRRLSKLKSTIDEQDALNNRTS
jgi:hypothetical protein